MDRNSRRFERRGQGARSSHPTNRPWIGRIALALLLFVPLFTPHIASAAENGPQGRVIGCNAATTPDLPIIHIAEPTRPH